MSLNDRPAMDHRFPYHHRQVVRGFMLGTGTLYRVVPLDPGESTWNPLAADPADRKPKAPTTDTPIYQGPCRVQPNMDWRARKQSSRDETYVEHAVRIQLDFLENKLQTDKADFPVVRVGDVFRVTAVHEWGGLPVDNQVMDYMYVVRNITSSTNGWVRNLLCDNDVTKARV